MPLPAALVTARFDGGLLGLGQTAARFRPAGPEVIAIHIFHIAAFAPATMPKVGEICENN